MHVLHLHFQTARILDSVWNQNKNVRILDIFFCPRSELPFRSQWYTFQCSDFRHFEFWKCWNPDVLCMSQMSEIWTCWNANWLLFGFRHCLKSKHSDFRHSLHKTIYDSQFSKGPSLVGPNFGQLGCPYFKHKSCKLLSEIGTLKSRFQTFTVQWNAKTERLDFGGRW